MITVTRWLDGDPALVVRSPDGEPAAWDNGDVVQLSVGRFEIAMEPALWEQVCLEVRDVLGDRLPRPIPGSVVGKNAGDVRTVEVTTFNNEAPVFADLPPAVPLAERLADLLGFGAGRDELTDDALLAEVGRLHRLHQNRLSLAKWRAGSDPEPQRFSVAADIAMDELQDVNGRTGA